MIFGQPVDGPRIVPFGEQRLPTDVLPNGRPGFRVTQRFDDPDAYHNDGRLHAALDVGNFACGDRVLAMGPGWAVAGTDNAGGRYVIVDHGNGWHSRYWHLNDWSVAVGQRTQVGKGQQVGIVGRTGLGDVCHLHLEVAFNGTKRDLWPLLEQNAGLPDTSTEDPMPNLVARIDGQRLVIPRQGIPLRTAATTNGFQKGEGDCYYVTSQTGMRVPALHGEAEGTDYDIGGGRTANRYYVFVAQTSRDAFTYGYVPKVYGAIEPIQQPTDCGPQVQAATDPLRGRIDNLKAISADSNKRIQNG